MTNLQAIIGGLAVIIAGGLPTAFTIRNGRKADKNKTQLDFVSKSLIGLEIKVDGRMEEVLQLTKDLYKLEGQQMERVEERDRQHEEKN